MANSVVTNFEPSSEFLNMTQNYDAQVGKAKSVEEVNSYVSQKTNDKIQKITDTLPPKNEMLVFNVACFRDSWLKKFEDKTVKDTFMTFDGKGKRLDMIHIPSKLFYYEDPSGIKAVQLIYKTKGITALIILHPFGFNINIYFEKIDSAKLSQIINGLQKRKVSLTMPKFELEFKTQLKESLKTLGMEDVFTEKADFTGMKPEKDIYI